MEKKIKPYGKLYIRDKEYYLLEPYTERNVFSDGTFEFLVVPFNLLDNRPRIPRFLRTTEFSLEYIPFDHEIKIKVSEEE